MVVSWDPAGRHTGTGGNVGLKRYPDGGLWSRTDPVAGERRFGFSGNSGDQFSWVQTASNAVETAVVSLPGGVTLHEHVNGTSRWTLGNLHGDTAAMVDQAGVKQGVTLRFGPFGEPLTTTPGTADVFAGTADPGWLGALSRLTDTQESDTRKQLVRMGARPYSPYLGRFLAVDPVEMRCI
jgi:hypothetical protein